MAQAQLYYLVSYVWSHYLVQRHGSPCFGTKRRKASPYEGLLLPPGLAATCCDYPNKGVKVVTTHMAKFIYKANVKPEKDLGFCEYLLDEYELRAKNSTNYTAMVTLL